MAAHRLFFHLTWSTLRRLPMINRATAEFLDGFIRRVAIQERVEVVALATLKTHVHLLVRSGPRIDLSRLVQLLKGGSSYAANRAPGNVLGLRWNREYSATSVGPRALPIVINYLKSQDRRHPDEAIGVPLNPR